MLSVTALSVATYAAYDQITDAPEVIVVEVERQLTMAEQLDDFNAIRQSMEAAADQQRELLVKAKRQRQIEARKARSS